MLSEEWHLLAWEECLLRSNNFSSLTPFPIPLLTTEIWIFAPVNVFFKVILELFRSSITSAVLVTPSLKWML